MKKYSMIEFELEYWWQCWVNYAAQEIFRLVVFDHCFHVDNALYFNIIYYPRALVGNCKTVNSLSNCLTGDKMFCEVDVIFHDT